MRFKSDILHQDAISPETKASTSPLLLSILVMENNQLPSLPALFSIFLFMFLVLRTWKKSKTSGQNLPPGPWKLPLIGNLHQFFGSLPHHRLRDLAKKYGPVMHLQIGHVSNIIISSPEAAKQVMKIHDVAFADRPFSLHSSIVSYNSSIAFSPYGDYWRQLRKICILELLSAKRVQSFQSIRKEEVSNFISSVSSCAGSQINLTKMFFSLSYDITLRAAFGKRYNDPEAFKAVLREIVKTAVGFSVADAFPSFKLLHYIARLRSKYEMLHQKTDKILESIINNDEVREARGEDETENFVQVLLKLQQSEDLEFPLSINSVKAVLLDMCLGGTETSSTVVEWAVAEMLKNPRIMEKAQREVRQCFTTKGNVDEADLHQLKYLKLIIKETIRLHPPLPLLVPRQCRESCEIFGYKIPAEFKVLVNAWAIGRDPAYWTEPENFYPERFLDGLIDYKGTHFEYIPFGAGRRMCPGISFGLASVEHALAQLLYHFNWKLPNGQKPEDLDMTEDFSITVRRKENLCLIAIPYVPLS